MKGQHMVPDTLHMYLRHLDKILYRKIMFNILLGFGNVSRLHAEKMKLEYRGQGINSSKKSETITK